jgi:hypothetical protein
MKYRTSLGISLVLNAVLAGVLVFFVERQPAPNFLPSPLPQPVATAIAASAPKRAKLTSSHNKNGSGWQNWLQQLRDAGVPNDVLAGLVASDFENRWEKQRREMERRYKRGELGDDWLARFELQHGEEQEKEMRAALGDEGFRQWDKENTLRDYDLDALNLSSSETDALYQLRKDLISKQHDLDVARQNGELDSADYSEQQDALQKENDQQFKALLGDDRYAAMLNPDSEGEMRRSLQGLNVSDTQFEAMLDTQRKWNEQQMALEQDTQTDGKSKEEQMQALDAARDAEYQRVLGTDAFSELQKNQDSSYQMLKQNANVWQLSDSDIDSVYKALQYSQKSISDYQQQAEALQAQGQNVDWDKVQENIQQFSDQTEQSLKTSLGEDRFNKLKKNGLFNPGEN